MIQGKYKNYIVMNQIAHFHFYSCKKYCQSIFERITLLPFLILLGLRIIIDCRVSFIESSLIPHDPHTILTFGTTTYISIECSVTAQISLSLLYCCWDLFYGGFFFRFEGRNKWRQNLKGKATIRRRKWKRRLLKSAGAIRALRQP